jgi:tetratricopeptide (TPR) repeat protein
MTLARRVFLFLLILLAIASPAFAVDITEVPASLNNEAVKAFRRGLASHREKRWADAIKEYERSLDLGGRFPEAFNNLAYCYRKVGRVDRSIELYKVAIALRPLFVQAHDSLARAYLAKGDKAAALHEYEIVRRLDKKLAAWLWIAIQRNDPDYYDELRD